MSPYYWTSHGCSALFVSVCIFVCVLLYDTCIPNFACLCVHPQLPSVLVAQMASHSILRVCVCLPCCVCLFVIVSLCWYVCTFPPLLKCLWCTWTVRPRLCVCVLVFSCLCVLVLLCLCFCVYTFAYMLFPPCGGGAHGRTGQGCGKVWGGDLSH